MYNLCFAVLPHLPALVPVEVDRVANVVFFDGEELVGGGGLALQQDGFVLGGGAVGCGTEKVDALFETVVDGGERWHGLNNPNCFPCARHISNSFCKRVFASNF